MSHPALVQTYAPSSLPSAALGPRRPQPFASQAARYRDAELLSATPGQLVVMLFDKMLLTLRRARTACDAKQIEVRCEQILRASDMVTELRVSLDREQGGQIAAQLDALYAYMLRELLEANRRNDGARLDVVTRMAAELREAFAGAVAATSGALPTARSA